MNGLLKEFMCNAHMIGARNIDSSESQSLGHLSQAKIELN